MSEIESTTNLTNNTVGVRLGFPDFKNILNETSNILAKLPSGRNLSDHGGCPIIRPNSTLILLFRGWEGIPTTFLINICLSAILLFGFWLIILRVNKREKQSKTEYIANERSADCIDFVYGKRRSNHSILYTTKQINREHPKAYLPLILHPYDNLIRSRHRTPSNVPEPDLYLASVDDNQLNTNEDNKDLAQNQTPNSEDFSTFGEIDENEKQKLNQLKSIIWDDDFINESKTNFKVVTDSQPKKGLSQRVSQWFTKYFLITDKQIVHKRGTDALQYLTFQRYIIYFLVVVTFISLVIILPVHLSGDRLEDIPNSHFRKTTILNIKTDSYVLLIHSVMTVLTVVLGIVFMKTFSRKIGQTLENIDKKILLIESIPRMRRTSNDLKNYFEKHFPDVVIKRITFVYDIRRLTKLLTKLWTCIEAKYFCRHYKRRYGYECEVRPYCLGNFHGVCVCCLCCPKVDGLKYYREEQNVLQKDIDEELLISTANPKGLAFVTFETEEMASKVYKHFRRKHCYCYCLSSIVHRICFRESDPLNSGQCYVEYASFPEDIDWLDMAADKSKVCSLSLLINIITLYVFFFLSTPNTALEIFKNLTKGKKNGTEEQPEDSEPDLIYDIFRSYFPVLGYILMTSLLPQIIKLLTNLIPFRTKSDRNYSLMYRSYIFLILMVLILPSLETITLWAIFKQHMNDEEGSLQWSCLLPTENGAFFLKYVMTGAFMTNAVQITHISELALYTFNYHFISRNVAEYMTARQATKFQFPFGTYYPIFLLHFTLVVTFSIACPLIAPVGLFHMIVTHLTERYLIFNVFVPSKISRRIHSKAIIIVYFALLLLLFQVYTHLAAMKYTVPSFIVGIALILHFLFIIFEFFWDFIYFLYKQ